MGRYAITFGILPYLANLREFTYSAWVRQDVNPFVGQPFAVLVSRCVDLGTGRRGNFLLLNTNGDLWFNSYKTPTDGEWKTASGALPSEDVWYHVLLTYDNTSAAADPVIYVDGVSKALTETVTPSGTTDDDSDCPLVLFNLPASVLTSDEYYYDVINNVALKDIRIYNRILNSEEISELATEEGNFDTVQDGLLFCGPFVPSDNIDDYIGDTIENDDWVIDIVHRAAGIPYNESSDPAEMMTGESV
jgi:hypothetical protein